jgi:hypothetical protein
MKYNKFQSMNGGSYLCVVIELSKAKSGGMTVRFQAMAWKLKELDQGIMRRRS